MELNSKQLMIAAAVGAAAWYLTRKKSAPAAAAVGSASAGLGGLGGLGSILSGIGAGSGTTTGTNKPLQVGAPDVGTTKPLAANPGLGSVMEAAGGSLKPLVAGAAAPIAAAASGAVWGGTVSGGSKPITASVSATGLRTYSDGSTEQMSEGAFHMYKLQQGGQVPFYAG